MSLGSLLRRSTGFYKSKSDIFMSCRSDFHASECRTTDCVTCSHSKILCLMVYV